GSGRVRDTEGRHGRGVVAHGPAHRDASVGRELEVVLALGVPHDNDVAYSAKFTLFPVIGRVDEDGLSSGPLAYEVDTESRSRGVSTVARVSNLQSPSVQFLPREVHSRGFLVVADDVLRHSNILTSL